MQEKHSIVEKTVFQYGRSYYDSLDAAKAQKEKDDATKDYEKYNEDLVSSSPKKYVGVKDSRGIHIASKTTDSSGKNSFDWNCPLQDRYPSKYCEKLSIVSTKEVLDYILTYDDCIEGEHFGELMEAIYEFCEEHPEYYPKIIKHLSTLHCTKHYSY